MKPLTRFLFAFLALLASTHSTQAAGRKLAVVVGVNAYRPNSGLPTLQHAGSDAAKLSAALRANGFTVFANGLHHVTQRGLERRNIVLDDDDRSHWWRLLERVARRCRWRVFAVALLDNHFHIFLRTPLPNLSDGMRDLDGGYASLFNQLHEREGALYQGRFIPFIPCEAVTFQEPSILLLKRHRANFAIVIVRLRLQRM